MSAQTYPGVHFEKVTAFPFTERVRRIYVPSGDVTIVSGGTSTSIPDADLAAINNQPVFIDEITSAVGGVVYVVR